MDELIKRLREKAGAFDYDGRPDIACDYEQAADAIEELQATLCNWCAVCPEDKRDLSTCEIYESCRAKPPKEE
jgi:hypothetical protein